MRSRRERVKSGISLALALCLGTLVSVAGADIYIYKDLKGRIHLTDRPMQGSNYRLLRHTRSPGSRAGSTHTSRRLARNRARFSPVIKAVAVENRLQPELLHAVIRAESAYDPSAISPAGAVGLMQLMPGTAERYGVVDRRDPKENLAGGARYLRDLLDLFEFDLKLALAAYNAGENAVLRHGKQVPPYAETRQYVDKVLRFYRESK